MDKPTQTSDRYLHDLERQLEGSRRARKRLLAEIRDHLEDAVVTQRATGVPPERAEQQALEQLGAPQTVAETWNARCSHLRKKQRLRGTLIIVTVATATILAAAQHANGKRDPTPPPATTTP